MNTELRNLLRSETASRHVSLENQLNLSQKWTPARYREVLSGFYGFHKAIEMYLNQFDLEPHRFYADGRTKTTALEKDLKEMDVDLARLPVLATSEIEARRWNEADRCWGLLYVIEGSTLGGQFLEKELESQLGRRSDYFSGYGPDTGLKWRQFLAHLPETDDASRLQDVLDGARAAFDLMAQWMPR